MRMRAWHSLNWHGQTGGDKGRDIIGVCADQLGNKVAVVVACANWQKFTLAKAEKDIDRLTCTQSTPSCDVIVVAGGDVGAETKDNCKAHADSKKINVCQVWSGPDFEEHLRFHAPSVVNRFFHGDALPDSEQELRDFMLQLDPATESPSAPVSEGLAACSKQLNRLRITLDRGIKSNAIQPCQCGNPLCTTYMVDPPYDQQLEIGRSEALQLAATALRLLGVNIS